MKINTQNIPPELAALYRKLISRKPTAAGAAFIARTKPRALKKAAKRPKRPQVNAIEKAVDFLIAYLTVKNGVAPPSTFRASQIALLKAGFFDPVYWEKCTEATSTSLVNFPTWAPFSGPRNYAYPDPNNQPSTPTYGAGSISAGNPAYEGATSGLIFKDVSLKWWRKTFTLKNSFQRSTYEPLFLKVSGNITATANARPSKAMLSAVAKLWIVTSASSRLTTTETPLTKPINAYWRYLTPRGEAPYFNLTKPLKLIYNARSKKYEETPGILEKAVVLFAPMPMKGRRFNNNTAVNTSITANVELWQIKKQKPTKFDSTYKGAFVALFDDDLRAWINGSGEGMVRAIAHKATGKYYWEVKVMQAPAHWFFSIGVSSVGVDKNSLLGNMPMGWAWMSSIDYGSIKGDGTNFNPYASPLVANDIVSVLLDLDAGTLAFKKNNINQGIAFSGLAGDFYPSVGGFEGMNLLANFGASAFVYPVPDGYTAGIL